MCCKTQGLSGGPTGGAASGQHESSVHFVAQIVLANAT